jgi:hypothetical protein
MLNQAPPYILSKAIADVLKTPTAIIDETIFFIVILITIEMPTGRISKNKISFYSLGC